jgi:hypothetical protein
MTCESSVRAILLIALLQLYPWYCGMHIIYFLHLLSTNHLLLKTCCSEAGEDVKFFDEEF